MVEWDKLRIETKDLDWKPLLEWWSWLLSGGRHYPVMMTIFGDWFLANESGEIHFLDLVSGEFTKIASTAQEFQAALTLEDNRDQWFMEQFAYECFDTGLRPGPSECIGFKLAPCIGGAIEIDNMEVSDLTVYQAIMGQLHQQTRDLPEGTHINEFRTEDSNDA